MLYISKASSSIAYNTGIYFLERVRDAIINQDFPENYYPHSDDTNKKKARYNTVDKFWQYKGELLEDILQTKPIVDRNTKSDMKYVVRFGSETSKKIRYEDQRRPLFRPIYEQMTEIIKEHGRKELMRIVKENFNNGRN